MQHIVILVWGSTFYWPNAHVYIELTASLAEQVSKRTSNIHPTRSMFRVHPVGNKTNEHIGIRATVNPTLFRIE